MELDCAAEGSPEPEVVWTKNGEVIPGEQNIVIMEIRIILCLFQTRRVLH